MFHSKHTFFVSVMKLFIIYLRFLLANSLEAMQTELVLTENFKQYNQ